MKVLATGKYASPDRKDYYTIVIDKQAKTIFALKNFSCVAAERMWLAKHFVVDYVSTDTRFSHVFNGTSIDTSRIPKKYLKFTILQRSNREIAAKLMKTIMYDNGVVNRLHPEVYSLKHVEIIANEVEKCLAANENLEFDEEVIECLCTGEDSEMQALVDSYDSLKPLHDALNNFFK